MKLFTSALLVVSCVAPAVYAAELGADGDTIAGLFAQGPVRQSLALRRIADDKK
jgi:hypothetical protein